MTHPPTQPEPSVEAWNEMREAVLSERYELAEAGLDSTQVNMVLAVIDRFIPAAQQPDTASLTTLRQVRDDMQGVLGMPARRQEWLRKLNVAIARLEHGAPSEKFQVVRNGPACPTCGFKITQTIEGDDEPEPARPVADDDAASAPRKLTVKRGPREVVLDLSRPDACKTLIAGLLDELNIIGALGRSPSARAGEAMRAHVLYRTGDDDAPESIKDSNGEVVLGLCRRCGRGEVELDEPCSPRAKG